MSLINLLNEQKKENERAELKNSGRTLLSGVALAGTAYFVNENVNLTGGVKKSYGKLKNSSAAGNELGAAGRIIRSNADQVQEILEASKQASLDKFKQNVLSEENLEKLLSGSGNVEEARAFLSALFDNASEELIDDSSVLRSSIKKLYEGVGKGTIEDHDRQVVTDFYRQNISTSGERLENFKRRYGSELKVAGQFDRVLGDFTVQNTSTIDYQVFDESGLSTKGRNKLNRLRKMTPGKGLTLVSINEFGTKGKGGPSVYARINTGGRFHNVALQLQEHSETGAKIIRGTENLSTRYTAPAGILDAERLFPSLDLKRLNRPGGISVEDAFRNATISLEDHLFNMLEGNRRSLQNFNVRNINQYNDYIRSMSIETPRATMEDLNLTKLDKHGNVVNLIDPRLGSTLRSSRAIQSNILKIVGLENFAHADREQVTKTILQYAPEYYGGTSGAQTLTSKFDDPMDLTRTRVVGHVERIQDQSGNRVPTAFNLFQRYGRLDRSLIPQTARGAQLHGRPEMTTGFTNVADTATFGRGGGIKISGSGRELLGITSDDVLARNASGVNFGAIMLFKGRDATRQLGLGEGMSYMGGRLRMQHDISKTVTKEGLGQSKLLTRLLEARSGNQSFLTIGSVAEGDDYDIDDFFRQFGDSEGRAILGKQDDRNVVIKRHKGLKRFTLGLSEKSFETGRDRYHIIGFRDQEVANSKLFSELAKVTNLPITELGMRKKLSELGMDDVAEIFFRGSGFGGNINNTLLTSTANVEKAGHFLRTQVFGGLRMLGLGEDGTLNALDRAYEGDKLLNEINSRLGNANNIQNLNQATARQIEGSTLGLFFETIAERAGAGGINADEFGLVLSLAHDRAANKKFGMDLEYFQNKIRMGLRKGLNRNDVEEYIRKTDEMAKRGVVIGAASGVGGTPHTNLGRNTARAEPRFANYLYTSLRGFWGMDANESASYVSSMMMRMEGFESRASGLIGMKVTQESLGKIGASRIEEQISGLEDVRRLSKSEVEDLLRLGQGEEAEVVRKLSEAKGGNIINLEEIGLSRPALDRLYETTGGKKEIFLPGEDTFKGFMGHEIRSSGETIKIEAQYSRSITDLISAISGLKDAEVDPDMIESSMRGFNTVRGSLSKVAASAIRGSLSGRILGSGSYMGGGFTIGDATGKGATLFSSDATKQGKIVAGLKEVINKEMGYVAFMDEQAFLDGMSTYKSALTRDLTSQSNKSVKGEVRRLMTETLEAFFTGMHSSQKRGHSGTIQRNPLLGFSHIWAGMGIYQYDFEDELDSLKFLRNMHGGKEFTDTYRDHLKGIRKSLNRISQGPKLNALLTAYPELEDETLRGEHFDKVKAANERYNVAQARLQELSEDPDYKELVEKQKELHEEKIRLREDPQFEAIEERRMRIMRGEDIFQQAEERTLMLSQDVGEQHQGRLKRLGKLEKRAEGIPLRIDKLKRESRKLKTTDTEGKSKIEAEIKRLEAEKAEVKKQTADVIKQLEWDEKNVQFYGRKILSGKDVSVTGVQRVTRQMFEETLSDFGYMKRTGKGVYRHFQTEGEARSFIESMKGFFGTDGKQFNLEAELKKPVEGSWFRGERLHPLEDMRFENPDLKDYIKDITHRRTTASGGLEVTKNAQMSRIDAFRIMVGDVTHADVEMEGGLKAITFTERIKNIREEEQKLAQSHAGAPKQKERKKVIGELDRVRKEQQELKINTQIIKDAQQQLWDGGDPDAMTLGEIDKTLREDPEKLSMVPNAEFTGERLKDRTKPKTHSDLLKLDEALGRDVKTGADLQELQEMNRQKKLTDEQSGAYKRIYAHMHRAHQEFGEEGGGRIMFPQMEIDFDIVDSSKGNKVVSSFSGRMDFTAFGIGDYDADPYQVFFDTDGSVRNRISSGKVDARKMYTYGAEFLTSMNILGQGVSNLAERMGASQLTVAQSIVDEFQKEQIVKGIGGLDVQVKAGMLGLAQAAADDTANFDSQFKRIKAGAALVSVAQEVLGIKGKKLPIAADISREYMTALKTSFESGEGSALKNFFREKILRGTALEDSGAVLRVDESSVKFHDFEEGAATRRFRQALSEMNLNVQELFETFDVMAANVKKHGWNRFTSDNTLGNTLMGSRRFNSEQLFGLLNRGYSMEGGLITGDMGAIEDIFDRAEQMKQALTESIGRSKGLAGIIAGGLLTSYAVGANRDIGSLEPGGKFSDSRSREALRAGQSLSQRGLQQNLSREHGQPSPGRINGGHNLYERPINSGVTTVSLNRSIRMLGEAPNLSTAQTMGRHFVSSGGQASLTINDTRQPIGNAYINKMMRD